MKNMSEDNTNPGECDCCYYGTTVLNYHKSSKRWLCDICSHTTLANMDLYPDNYEGTTIELAKIMAYGFNMIADVIRDKK